MFNQIKSLISTITFRDILDILINSYLLFRIYVLFYGTTLFRSLIGIVFLFLCQRITFNYGLIMSSYLLQGITTVALFILVIGFRNEIRGILRLKSIGDIFWKLKKTNIDKSIYNPIIEAVFNLAKKRVGALIVIPGKNNVAPFITNGTQIASPVSVEMLETIFMSKGPLHDGAVIIDGNKIARAGALLPLSERQDIPYYFGTRHRAALGLSEVCDALVIVVSEERGVVSLAHGSEIFSVSDKKDLLFLLESHLGEVTGDVSKKGYLNYGVVALLCFMLVSSAWFTFTRGKTSFSSFEVPIEIIKRDSNMEIVSASPNKFKIILSGPQVIMRTININDINLFLKINDNKPGNYVYNITEKNLSLPPGIKLVKINPSSISVKLDKIIEKDFDIQVNWVGKIDPNLLITKCIVSPPKVKIQGPQTILEKMSTIYTEPISVDNIQESGEIEARLDLPPNIKMVNKNNQIVDIKYLVERRK